MQFRRCSIALLACILTSCAGAQHGAVTYANRCEVNHTISDGDTVESQISRSDDGWTVSLTMRMRLTPESAPIEIVGSGRVTGGPAHRVCHVTESTGAPGQPRFDEDLCLDELESIADVLDDAEQAARPGETVVQEVRLRPSRRRHARSHVVRATAFRERAEITRDPQGRVIRVVRNTQAGGHETVQVSYPSESDGRCLPQD